MSRSRRATDCGRSSREQAPPPAPPHARDASSASPPSSTPSSPASSGQAAPASTTPTAPEADPPPPVPPPTASPPASAPLCASEDRPGAASASRGALTAGAGDHPPPSGEPLVHPGLQDAPRRAHPRLPYPPRRPDPGPQDASCPPRRRAGAPTHGRRATASAARSPPSPRLAHPQADPQASMTQRHRRYPEPPERVARSANRLTAAQDGICTCKLPLTDEFAGVFTDDDDDGWRFCWRCRRQIAPEDL